MQIFKKWNIFFKNSLENAFILAKRWLVFTVVLLIRLGYIRSRAFEWTLNFHNKKGHATGQVHRSGQCWTDFMFRFWHLIHLFIHISSHLGGYFHALDCVHAFWHMAFKVSLTRSFACPRSVWHARLRLQLRLVVHPSQPISYTCSRVLVNKSGRQRSNCRSPSYRW